MRRLFCVGNWECSESVCPIFKHYAFYSAEFPCVVSDEYPAIRQSGSRNQHVVRTDYNTTGTKVMAQFSINSAVRLYERNFCEIFDELLIQDFVQDVIFAVLGTEFKFCYDNRGLSSGETKDSSLQAPNKLKNPSEYESFGESVGFCGSWLCTKKQMKSYASFCFSKVRDEYSSSTAAYGIKTSHPSHQTCSV